MHRVVGCDGFSGKGLGQVGTCSEFGLGHVKVCTLCSGSQDGGAVSGEGCTLWVGSGVRGCVVLMLMDIHLGRMVG